MAQQKCTDPTTANIIHSESVNFMMTAPACPQGSEQVVVPVGVRWSMMCGDDGSPKFVSLLWNDNNDIIICSRGWRCRCVPVAADGSLETTNRFVKNRKTKTHTHGRLNGLSLKYYVIIVYDNNNSSSPSHGCRTIL